MATVQECTVQRFDSQGDHMMLKCHTDMMVIVHCAYTL